ncbi:dynamin family protein [Clostridium butyricum]|uniref:dynamin family protein n=1 Tax=Clostridium butyricum TaxID=1492 RepID=UPI00071B8127|nr:dynamin family protein [Clostridium butyricum]ALP90878.1 GTP-binding protein [Clostridium butyricum]ALS17405.1 GTP-binding protein [Clostridium butyricum]ANF14500.1 GTP-binding protein [Clostridium butyricum]AOR94565.1 GTP-binding protein [Clostridium butyricum]APF23559.1 dynamin family protein [Clostridium butyricum]
MNIFDNCIKRQEKIDSIVKTLGIKDIIDKNSLVKERVVNPSHYVVMLGETSSGKSALINSILEKKIMIESVRPTTGVVAEVVVSDEEDIWSKVGKDGSITELEKDEFDKLVVNPTSDIHRLRYKGRSKEDKFAGIRLFDTPGYGSLVDYHEDILKEFIPEGDFIVYVVSYRVGLNDDDYQFLKYVGEIISDKVEVILAINMCPKDITEDNKRITEIRKNINECIHRDVETFLIESSSEKNPDAQKLWNYIYERVNNPEKIEELGEALKNYQDYVLGECEIKVNSKIASIESAQNDLNERKKLTKEFFECKEEITAILERGFTKTKVKSVRLIDKAAATIKEDVRKYVEDETKWTKREETYSFMQHYYVPKLTTEETEHILSYIEDEIILLDKAMKEILNKTAAVLEDKVKVNIPCYSEVMEGILKKHIGDAMKQAAGEMFRSFDSKKKGNKDSSRTNFKRLESTDTEYDINNNGLAKLIKAIRATSLKGITHYLSVFTDSIIYLYDTLTWQNKIQEISMEAIDNWAQDVEGAVRKYIDEFKETNRREIMSLFDELTQEFSEDETDDVIEDIDHETLIKLKREIDFILHKCLFASI